MTRNYIVCGLGRIITSENCISKQSNILLETLIENRNWGELS